MTAAPDAIDGAAFHLEPPVRFSVPQCLFLGLLVAVPIAPEARLTLFDATAMVLILWRWQSATALMRGAMILLVVSLVAMTVSAQVNGSELRALAGRGYQLVALLIETAGYCLIVNGTSDKGRASLVLGAMIGICCHYFYPSDLRVLGEPIKFLIGIPLGAGLLALYALVIPKKSTFAPLIMALMVGYALFCFASGSRSIGGVYFASALLVGTSGFVRIPASYAKFAPLILIAAGLVGYGLTELYTLMAIKGFFGERAASIAAFQSSFGSIILGGRPEIIVNLIGIREAPVLGVGILNYPSVYLYDLINLSVYSQDEVLDIENILYHSALFGTAFESGIIASLFWAYLAYRAILVVPLLKTLPLAIRAFVMPLVLISIWHILYSPPISYNRFVMGVGLGFVFNIYADWKRQRLAPTPPPDGADQADPASSTTASVAVAHRAQL